MSNQIVCSLGKSRSPSGIAITAVAVFLCWLCAQALPAQSTAAKTPTSPEAPAKTPEASGSLGFAIESEMLTYRALQDNSEATACDVAAYIRGTASSFAGGKCLIDLSGASGPGVVVLAFDQQMIKGFQLWRVEMETMKRLRSHAASYCPSGPKVEVAPRGAKETGVTPFDPASAGISVAQVILGMISSQTEAIPVAGTIEDQGYIDGVSRQLRALGVSVIVPSVYAPFSLSPLDESRSPFIAGLNAFVATRDCLQERAVADPSNTGLSATLAEMNAFLAAFNPGESPSNSTASPAGVSGKTDNSSGGKASPGAPAQFQQATPVSQILLSDSIAQKLGVDPATGSLAPNSIWKHILFLHALESGGSVMKHSNLFGTRIRYSGGSVATYALFSMAGDLECSGNVFDFGGSIPARDFQKELHHYTLDPSSQFLFQRGGCQINPKQ